MFSNKVPLHPRNQGHSLIMCSLCCVQEPKWCKLTKHHLGLITRTLSLRIELCFVCKSTLASYCCTSRQFQCFRIPLSLWHFLQDLDPILQEEQFGLCFISKLKVTTKLSQKTYNVGLLFSVSTVMCLSCCPAAEFSSKHSYWTHWLQLCGPY